MTFGKNLLIFAIFCILQHFAYLIEISEDERNYRIKRQCGCCSCNNSGTSCACSSPCACAASNYATGYGYGNMGYGGNGINFNAGYNGYGYGYGNIGYGGNGINFNAGYNGYGFGSNPENLYTTYGQYNPIAYGSNYNMGNGCGLGGGIALPGGCGASNMFPYNFGRGYNGNFDTSNTGYIYPQVTSCSTAFNTRCYCGTGYSPCNNGTLCCRNGTN
ncbi:unnamed protein product [Cercopithifilaria johnstoni]|uniref:Uncharacterized protein n=1 Tax=Cercopithifilaria johnstoni TaxID=2874296 RepID=A0A8J2PY89_9BILA|nr:unnamed protein product [Cercopithifilaria johnstoni]